MDEPADTIAVCETKKRPFPDNEPHVSIPLSGEAVQSVETSTSMPTPPLTAESDNGSPAQSKDALRQASPALSTSTLSSLATSTQEPRDGASGTLAKASSSTPRPAKRRKLTVVEKEQQLREKEAKEREKAEKKAKREEEKTKKEEEKRVKDEERRRKNEEREVKQREKDLEKQRKEEERAKKERSQMRLNSFFAKPATPKPASTQVAPSQSPLDNGRRKSLSLGSEEPMVELQVKSVSPERKPTPAKRSDYEVVFLPFALPSYTTCAPYSRFVDAKSEADAAANRFDKLLQNAFRPSTEHTSPADLLKTWFAQDRDRSRGLWQPNVREVIESLQGSPGNPVDLTADGGEGHRPEDLLEAVSIRHLHFAEDVRPPYHGSYSKITLQPESARLRRNPFSKVRKDTDYGYDSEAEWEEPEEGEDILSDGEDDVESIGSADDMDGFLDDEDAGDAKRKVITGDLKPISTGLCWEDASGKLDSYASEVVADLEGMRVEFLIDLPTTSINPFSTSYWQTQMPPPPQPASEPTLQLQNGLLKLRPPLQTRQSNESSIVGAASGMKGPIMAVEKGKAAKAPVKKLSSEDLAEFKEAVQGSNLTKIELLKALKKRFPKLTNETIKDTLSSDFARVGATAAEKRWIFISDS